MKIKRLYINNYKSLVDFELLEPNPFSVFVGPNAAGKSNVFEALEFLSYANDVQRANDAFGGAKDYLNKQFVKKIDSQPNSFYDLWAEIDFAKFKIETSLKFKRNNGSINLFTHRALGEMGMNAGENWNVVIERNHQNQEWYSAIFSRIFVNESKLVRTQITSSNKLALDCSNLENVLLRLLQDEIIRDEMAEWMESLIPELEKIEVGQSELSGDYVLRIFEKHLDEPIRKNLISNGTYNILALLTAVYQSDEPQFLCIEEPENGLTPFVIRELVSFFRQLCEEKGHYIWLNTHSPYLVRQLEPKEIILIDKKEGITRAKQVDKDLKFKTMKMDEAWLSNALGGGLPW